MQRCNDFLSTLNQLRLMLFEMFYHRQKKYLVVSSVFHRNCGSLSNMLECKSIILLIQLSCPHRMWLINVVNELSVVIRNQYDGDADKVLDYLEDNCIGCFCWNALPSPNALLFFLSSYGTCSIEPTKSFREQKTISSLGITVFQANVQFTHPTFWKF